MHEGFPILYPCNDYLEEVEDTTCKLMERTDVVSAKKTIKKNQDERYEAIILSKERRAEEETAFGRNEMHNGVADATPTAIGMDLHAQESNRAAASAALRKCAPTMFLAPRPTGQQPLALGTSSNVANGEREDEETKRLKEVKALSSGGWTIDITRRRCYEEAIVSTWVS